MASLTVATKMSPIDAYRRLEPPSTLMHSTSLAPELSATRRRVSCWIIDCSPGPFEHFDQAPALELRQRTSLLDADTVADVEVVGLVVHVQLLRALQRLAIERMANAVDDRNHRRLVHRRGHDRALTDLARVRPRRRGVVSHRCSPVPRRQQSPERVARC